jgi:glutathione S-transferase
VARVAQLSAATGSTASLAPDDAGTAEGLLALCEALPPSARSPALDELLGRCEAALARGGAGGEPFLFLAGGTFSTADACLLPFLQRVESDLPADAAHLRAYYMRRVHALPAFAKTVAPSWWWWW